MKLFKILLQVLIGVIAVLVSLWICGATLLMLAIMGATVSYFTDPWQGYVTMVFVFLIAIAVIFCVCSFAKRIIIKLNK